MNSTATTAPRSYICFIHHVAGFSKRVEVQAANMAAAEVAARAAANYIPAVIKKVVVTAK